MNLEVEAQGIYEGFLFKIIIMARVTFTDDETTLDIYRSGDDLVIELESPHDYPSSINIDTETAKKVIERIEDLIFEIENE